MKKQAALKVIENELEQFDVPKASEAYRLTKEQALEAAEVMNQAQLKQYVKEYLESLPNTLFHD